MFSCSYHRLATLLSAFVFIAASQSACTERCKRVDGPRERYEIPLNAVHTLEVNTAADVQVRKTKDNTNGTLELYAQPEVYFGLISRFKDSTLRFSMDACYRGQAEVLMDARMQDIRQLRMNAAGKIQSSDLLELDSLHILNEGLGDIQLHIDSKHIFSQSSASGNVILSGEVDQLFAVNTGSGELSCFDLFADTVIIENYGSGIIEVHADEFLQVNFAQETTVRYRGNPRVITVAGEGNLVNANLGI